MTTLERSPITQEDICAQVVAMGGEVTAAIGTLAETFARKLSEADVQKRADCQPVDSTELARATSATGRLLELQIRMASSLEGTRPETDDPAELSAEDASVAAIGVQAAIARLLGDTEDPVIRTFELVIRHAVREAS